jgi:molybdenum cofactor biosynthesis enzyme
MNELTLFAEAGRARMVDVPGKPGTRRAAISREVMRIENIELEEKRGGKTGTRLRRELGQRIKDTT